ncbi:MAG TPA: hypothetical protein VFM18_22160 [Methanosarcina sp.]|nr:hypothetical protein [Methanosarcina sp.]
MPTFLKQILTLSDNVTYDIVRVLAVISFIQYLGSEAWVLYKTTVFDAQSFGIGLGAVIAGVGVALKFNPDNGGQNA